MSADARWSDRDDSRRSGFGQRIVEPDRKREMAEVVGRELHLVALGEMVSSCQAITPALLLRMSCGPSQAATKESIEARSVSSKGTTLTASLPVKP